MAEKCKMYGACHSFQNYDEYQKKIKSHWISLYCGDAEKAVKCERLNYLIENGKPPPDTLAPAACLSNQMFYRKIFDCRQFESACAEMPAMPVVPPLP
jgi:hypothetical protein